MDSFSAGALVPATVPYSSLCRLALSARYCIRFCIRFPPSSGTRFYFKLYPIPHIANWNEQNTNFGDRTISVLGLVLAQVGFWATSTRRKSIPWPTVIVGLFLQQAIALFVLKSGAGFSIFKWLATLASDFLNQALVGAAFFFDQDTVNKHWFFVNTLSSIIFFIAFVQMMYYVSVIVGLAYTSTNRASKLGVMQWILKNL